MRMREIDGIALAPKAKRKCDPDGDAPDAGWPEGPPRRDELR
jgi:hypothetical protein